MEKVQVVYHGHGKLWKIFVSSPRNMLMNSFSDFREE